ncbi:MAG: DNA mismatch repair endonuclease MutL [Lentimicrobium sp.]|nr:DNA mismatch repair endonuclease MutL [Lentimicrobium sp.]
MSDIIRLLPDSVANQIAAGEVIQRPASAVKELLENAIDSGADSIELIVKDSGKTLLQVIDNGCGMSPTDARMSFERHATSKIKEAADLFKIHTFGFRGEALASIAAIAHVELKSRKIEEELGTQILIEGSAVKSQQACACASGTSIMVKNLFYNVPARRNFLKSEQAEMRHILEEFHRIVLVNPQIAFKLTSSGKILFNLPATNLKIRISNVFGSNFHEKLLSVNLESNVVKISGFIGKPESAKRTKGEQYFFANQRYIRHPYLNHAVEDAFSDLIPEGHFPTYFLYLEVDPGNIDINIHPTKTEVNFQDHTTIYAMLRSAVKQAIGRFSLSSTLDFDTEQSIETFFPKDRPVVMPGVHINPEYNPFSKNTQPELRLSPDMRDEKKDVKGWEQLFEVNSDRQLSPSGNTGTQAAGADLETVQPGKAFIQLNNRFVVTRIISGLMVVDQQAAHERILFEKLLGKAENKKSNSQQLLYPLTVNLSAPDAELVSELISDFISIGFQIEHFGGNSFIIQGVPSDLNTEDVQSLFEAVLQTYKNNQLGLKIDKQTNLIRSMARNLAIKPGKTMLPEEMQSLINDLFTCKVPEVSPSGKKIIIMIGTEEIEKKFG